MTDWTDGEAAALRRLIEKAEADPDFTSTDIAALRAMADTYRGLQYFGRFSKWIVFLLVALAGAIAAWETVTTKVRAWAGG